MNVFTELFRCWDSKRADLEVEEELQFHLDLLTEEHCRQNMSWDQARATALGRFGNVEQIRDECVRIARRNHPLVSALKWFFGFLFITGVLVRVFATDHHVTRIGVLLMEVGALSRLLLYLRGVSPSKYLPAQDDSAQLKLNDTQLSIAAYDEQTRTPVERVVSSK